MSRVRRMEKAKCISNVSTILHDCRCMEARDWRVDWSTCVACDEEDLSRVSQSRQCHVRWQLLFSDACSALASHQKHDPWQMKSRPSCPESLNSSHEFSENAVEFLVGRPAAAASACASYSSKNGYREAGSKRDRCALHGQVIASWPLTSL